ncbi:oligosaccharide flippase family protein [Acholeplasma sp. OttesenSCG-928-E16]|nr:oligosaccharide flippase family protein [Acholeplasma sp. OttesenSCG-928-E16]
MIPLPSRTKAVKNNTFFAALAFIIKTILMFINRTFFIRYLGVEYLGLNNLFTNILTILSLAELGLGNAIVYSMYKPVSEGNISKIKSLLSLYKKFYYIIGTIILAVGLSLLPALPFLMEGEVTVQANIYVIYVIFILSNVVGYYFAHRRALIFAYQRNDIESKVSMITQIILSALQILLLVTTKNYYLYTGAVVLTTIIDSVLIYIISYKLFNDIRGSSIPLEEEDLKEIKKNTKAMFIHKVGGALVFSTDHIIISSFLGLAVLGIYSNYNLVINTLVSIFGLLATAISSTVGNLIVEGDKKKIHQIFNVFNFCQFWLAGFALISLVVLFQDFIELWLDSSYLLDFNTMLVIAIAFFIRQMRGIVNVFKDSAGLFVKDRIKPVFEVLINIALDIILVQVWGVFGVLIATIISSIVTSLWIEPFVLFKYLFNQKVTSYFLRILIYVIIIFTSLVGTYFLAKLLPFSGVTNFVLKILICIVVPNIIFFLASFKTKEFKSLSNKVFRRT